MSHRPVQTAVVAGHNVRINLTDEQIAAQNPRNPTLVHGMVGTMTGRQCQHQTTAEVHFPAKEKFDKAGKLVDDGKDFYLRCVLVPA